MSAVVLPFARPDRRFPFTLAALRADAPPSARLARLDGQVGLADLATRLRHPAAAPPAPMDALARHDFDTLASRLVGATADQAAVAAELDRAARAGLGFAALAEALDAVTSSASRRGGWADETERLRAQLDGDAHAAGLALDAAMARLPDDLRLPGQSPLEACGGALLAAALARRAPRLLTGSASLNASQLPLHARSLRCLTLALDNLAGLPPEDWAPALANLPSTAFLALASVVPVLGGPLPSAAVAVKPDAQPSLLRALRALGTRDIELAIGARLAASHCSLGDLARFAAAESRHAAVLDASLGVPCRVVAVIRVWFGVVLWEAERAADGGGITAELALAHAAGLGVDTLARALHGPSAMP